MWANRGRYLPCCLCFLGYYTLCHKNVAATSNALFHMKFIDRISNGISMWITRVLVCARLCHAWPYFHMRKKSRLIKRNIFYRVKVAEFLHLCFGLAVATCYLMKFVSGRGIHCSNSIVKSDAIDKEFNKCSWFNCLWTLQKNAEYFRLEWSGFPCRQDEHHVENEKLFLCTTYWLGSTFLCNPCCFELIFQP